MPWSHQKWLPYKILGGKTIEQIDQQTTEIWPNSKTLRWLWVSQLGSDWVSESASDILWSFLSKLWQIIQNQKLILLAVPWFVVSLLWILFLCMLSSLFVNLFAYIHNYRKLHYLYLMNWMRQLWRVNQPPMLMDLAEKNCEISRKKDR